MGFVHVLLVVLVILVVLYPIWLLHSIAFFSAWILSSEGKVLVEISHVGFSVPTFLILCIISGCGSLILFSFAAVERFPDYDQTRH